MSVKGDKQNVYSQGELHSHLTVKACHGTEKTRVAGHPLFVPGKKLSFSLGLKCNFPIWH